MSNAPVSLFASVRSPHEDQFQFIDPGSNRDSDGTPFWGGSNKPTHDIPTINKSAQGELENSAPLLLDGSDGLAAMRGGRGLTREERLALRDAKQAEREAKQAEKEALKAQRLAEKEAKKAERDAKRAEKEAQRQEREKAKKEKNKPDEDEDNTPPVATPDDTTGGDTSDGDSTGGGNTGGGGTGGGSLGGADTGGGSAGGGNTGGGTTGGGTTGGGNTGGGDTGSDSGTDTASATGTDDGPLDVTGGTVGSDGLLTRYVSGGDAATSFNIDLNFAGDGWTAELQADMIAAADYLSRFIIGDLPDSTMFNGTLVDDIRIDVSLAEIDGRGKILGRAGPREYRNDLTPKQGIIEFDSADAERFDNLGRWDDIVLHEMMHVLGFGTIWSAKGLTSQSDTLRFTGEKATAVYMAEFGSDPNWGDDNMAAGVPIETNFGAGTAGAHWDEALFENELMTGIIDKNNYMSMTTLAALDDLGYETIIDNLYNFDDQVLLV